MQIRKSNLYKLMKLNFNSFDVDDMEFYEPIADVYEFSSNSMIRPSMIIDDGGSS